MGVYSGNEPLTSEKREQLRETLLKDRGPAYIPWLVTEFGAQAGLFMSQLLFWDGKGHDPAGWIYKSEKEWRNETGLTRSAVRNARKILTKKGVLEEDKRGLPRRLYYRADLRALMAVLNGEPLLPSAIEDPSDPEDRWDDLWDEDLWDEDEASEEIRRGEEEQPPVHDVNISEESTTSPTSEESISRLTAKEGITRLPSEEPTTVPTSEANNIDLAYTENTSENSTESLHRAKAGDSTLQVGANQEFAPKPKEKCKEDQDKQTNKTILKLSPEPTFIFKGAVTKSKAEQTYRATPEEIQLIYRMLTDERQSTCGVYRRFEKGQLSDQKLLEAVSDRLTGSFLEGERFRDAVEGCVQILKEEEGIA